MTRESRLPPGGVNLFQAIKEVREKAAADGVKILNLSIGQPQGPALLSARQAAAEAVMSDSESMHEYQDNGSPGVPNFAKRFVVSHVPSLPLDEVSFLPIPGIKPMLGLIPLACNLVGLGNARVLTTTNPGYGTPADWAGYLHVGVQAPELNSENRFRFDPEVTGSYIKLMMINFPHNPSGQTADFNWLCDLCEYCEKHNIRLFNDAAYYALSHVPIGQSTCLSEVAYHFPNLSWAEAFSASKIIGNGTGWRVGAIVGSPDFVSDIAKIKGNTDSGFFAPAAAGALHAVENDEEGIAQVRALYKNRLQSLRNVLEPAGMRLAVEPGAGFFTLWKVPAEAFGIKIQNAEHFNLTMIERTGVTGVHFNPGYIRYAVCTDIDAMASELAQTFKQTQVRY